MDPSRALERDTLVRGAGDIQVTCSRMDQSHKSVRCRTSRPRGQDDNAQVGYSTLEELAVTNNDRYGGKRLDVSPQVVLESLIKLRSTIDAWCTGWLPETSSPCFFVWNPKSEENS